MRKGWILPPVLLAAITLFLASDLFAWGDRGGKRGGLIGRGLPLNKTGVASAHDMLIVVPESLVME